MQCVLELNPVVLHIKPLHVLLLTALKLNYKIYVSDWQFLALPYNCAKSNGLSYWYSMFCEIFM